LGDLPPSMRGAPAPRHRPRGQTTAGRGLARPARHSAVDGGRAALPCGGDGRRIAEVNRGGTFPERAHDVVCTPKTTDPRPRTGSRGVATSSPELDENREAG